MRILLAEKGELEITPDTASAWGFETVSFESYDALYTHRTENPEESCIILLHSDLLPPEPLQAVGRLQKEQEECPSFVFLVGEAHEQARLLDLLTPPFCDVLVAPAYEKLLERKLEIAASVLEDKRTLIETSEIMERYAKHIDKIAEERAKHLVHAERLSTIGVMAAGIAHEFNTPISYMMTSLDTAVAHWQKLSAYFDEHGTDETIERSVQKFPKFLERLELGLTRLERLSRGLKSFGRNNADERVLCDIVAVIDDALEMCAYELRSHLEVRKQFDAPEELRISANPQQLEQVLINLFINASHATAEQEGGEIIIQTDKDDEWLYVTITDNGHGIPEEKLETIWKPFVTTKEQGRGTGLGLYIVRGIIRKHSGSIQVENDASTGGAKFTIKLPVVAE